MPTPPGGGVGHHPCWHWRHDLQGHYPRHVIGDLALDAGRVLRNEGNLTWNGGSFNLNASGQGGSGRIDNAAGAVWDAGYSHHIFASGHADLNHIAGQPAFNNAGAFRGYYRKPQLRISSLGGYNPSLNDWFTIMTFNTGGLTGSFDHIVAAGFAPWIRFHAEHLSDSVRIQVVPLPAAAWFMLSALGFLAARRLREESVS